MKTKMVTADRFNVEFEVVERETEKALLVRLPYSLADGEPRSMTAWVPKSQVSINPTEKYLEMPGWLAEKIEAAFGNGRPVHLRTFIFEGSEKLYGF